ncbi:MAG: hypothetical protein R3B95_19165 [Nitrospirales bacterium]|nr:hypothetical protein [Nitrospirales bacterium]
MKNTNTMVNKSKSGKIKGAANKKNSPKNAKTTTCSRPNVLKKKSPTESLLHGRFHSLDEQLYFETVFHLWRKSQITKQFGSDHHEALLRLTFSFEETDRSPHMAFIYALAAGRTGLPMPPWVFPVLDRAFTDRVSGRIKSLDAELGFSHAGRGKKGKFTSPIEKQLLVERNETLCRNVFLRTVHGEGVGAACHEVAKELIAIPDWNTKTIYDLNLIKHKTKLKDPLVQSDETGKALERLYRSWKKKAGKVTLDAIREKSISINH